MSDFDQFEGAEQPPQQEEDPAAEFLAREQDQLAALDDDNFGIADPVPAQPQGDSQPASGDAFQTAGDQGGEADFFGGSEDAVGAIDQVLDEFDMVGMDPDATSGFSMDDGAPTQPDDPYAAIKVTDTQRQEPEKIRIWRENQIDVLTKKDAASEEKKVEWRAVARKELEDWYKHRDEQLEKTKKNNREAEAAFTSQRDEKTEGHEWERICRLCDFNPKASRVTRDVSRMRSILLQLKQTPLVRA